MSPPLNFVFIDDSFHDVTRISSLTAIVVPIAQYAAVRSDFYDLLLWATQPEPGVIGLAPELHGRNFLRDQPDARKVQVLSGICSLVRRHKLRIYRIGYFITTELERRLEHDKRLVGTCWSSLLSMMQPLLADEMIIPVMDGLDEKSVRHFSGAIHQMDSFRSIGLEGSLSIRYTHNVLGEVFYADSRYSALIQVTDVIAYMRNASDLFDLGKPVTEFKTHLLEASRSIDECFVREHVVSMVVDGKVQGPAKYVIPIQTSSGPLSRMATVVPSDSESIPRPPRIQWPEGPHPDIEF